MAPRRARRGRAGCWRRRRRGRRCRPSGPAWRAPPTPPRRSRGCCSRPCARPRPTAPRSTPPRAPRRRARDAVSGARRRPARRRRGVRRRARFAGSGALRRRRRGRGRAHDGAGPRGARRRRREAVGGGAARGGADAARCAPASSAAAALVRAAVCAPLPGLDYHLDAALFNTKVFWDFVAALVDDGGRDAETAAAHLGLDLEQLERDAHAAARAAPLPTAVEILRDVRRGRWGATRRATRLFVARRLWLGVLVDALLSPAAPGAVATAAPVSLEELSRRTKIPEPALEKLARRAPIFAGAVARFCRRLNWTCVADGLDERAGALRRALRAFDKKPASWRAELRGLRKACGGDAQLARALRDANYRAAADVADAGVDAVEHALADAAPWRLAGVDAVDGPARRRHDASWSQTPFLVSLLSATRTTGAEAAAAAAARRSRRRRRRGRRRRGADRSGARGAAAPGRGRRVRRLGRLRGAEFRRVLVGLGLGLGRRHRGRLRRRRGLRRRGGRRRRRARAQAAARERAHGRARDVRVVARRVAAVAAVRGVVGRTSQGRVAARAGLGRAAADARARRAGERRARFDGRAVRRRCPGYGAAAAGGVGHPPARVGQVPGPPHFEGLGRLRPRARARRGEVLFFAAGPAALAVRARAAPQERRDRARLGAAPRGGRLPRRRLAGLPPVRAAPRRGARRPRGRRGGAARVPGLARARPARARACERLAGGRVAWRRPSPPRPTGGAYALACGDAVAVATALRSNGTPAGGRSSTCPPRRRSPRGRGARPPPPTPPPTLPTPLATARTRRGGATAPWRARRRWPGTRDVPRRARGARVRPRAGRVPRDGRRVRSGDRRDEPLGRGRRRAAAARVGRRPAAVRRRRRRVAAEAHGIENLGAHGR